MLFMNDINPANCKILKRVFGKEANIACVDFLATTSVPVFPAPFPLKYDIVMENPPYQIPKRAKYKGARGSNNTLWDRFIVKSFEMLNEGGWLGAITPANWRRPNHPLYSSIIAPNLRYLHIYGKKEGIRLFGVQTRFDVYLITKPAPTPTLASRPLLPPPTIVDEKGVIHRNIRPSKWAFLPNYAYNTVKKFFSLEKSIGKRRTAKGRPATIDAPVVHPQKVIYNSNEYNSKTLSLKKTRKYKYPVVHTITKKGLGVRWSSTKRGHFGVPKVLLNFNEIQYPYNDWKGEYGMSQLTFGIPVRTKKEGDIMVKKMNTPEFKEAIKATKWGSFQTDYRMFMFMGTYGSTPLPFS
jgi:hypothetical protein